MVRTVISLDERDNGHVRFLLDSTVLIDHLNGIPAAEAFLREHAVESCLWMEAR